MNIKNLLNVDWSKLPKPLDDAKLDHLNNFLIADIILSGTDGQTYNLQKLEGLSVIYIYPMTGQPNVELPKGWD
jgi:hypothetical protein